jgi:nitrite reductase/ring-hydroxylating ferredoxin subunit
MAIDPRLDSAAREGLTGTAPEDAYDPVKEPDSVTLPPDGAPEDRQPRWRRDFPIDWPADQYVARRDFGRFLILTSGAFAAGQAWIAAQHLIRANRPAPGRRRIAAVGDVPIGSAVVFEYPGPNDRCLLIRTAPRTFLAYSQICTHLSCAVVPIVAEGVLKCPCHEGYFDLQTGRNIAGPPPRPLPKIEIEIAQDEIYATGVVETPA